MALFPLPLPQRQHAEQAARRGEDGRRRPATAGATGTRSMAQTVAAGLAGHKEALGMTPRRGGGGEAALASAALARAGLSSSASDNGLFRTTRSGPHDCDRDGRVTTRRVFDSAAAEWVHTAVLKHGTRSTLAAATGAPRVLVGGIPSAAAGPDEDFGGASLTSAAKSAVEEVFDRFDRSGKAGRGFLLPTEIAALQEIWTRPDAEPPPPRQPPTPKSAPPRKSPRALAATSASRARPAAGVGAPLEVPEATGNGGPFDKRVLTRPAFVEFCRGAASRDAIFIRHLFTRSGYDYRLELTVPPMGSATTSEPATSSARQRKGSAVSERCNSKDSKRNTAGGKYPVELVGSGSRQGSRGQPHSRRGGSLKGGGGGGGGDGGKGIVPPISTPAVGSQHQGVFAPGNDEAWGLASGGLVDPAELWLWTEDERDHGGERQILAGLLSRGGGAHVSRTAAAAIAGAFASARSPRGGSAAASATKPTPGEENAGGASTAEAHGTEAGREASVGGLPPEANIARDNNDEEESDSASTAPTGEGGTISAQRYGAAPPPVGALLLLAGGVVEGSEAASRGPSTKCEWCGAVVVAGGKDSHSAAFCDEELVRVPEAR